MGEISDELAKKGKTQVLREGIAENPIEDAYNLGKEVFTGIFDTAALAIKYGFSPGQYGKDVRLLGGSRAGNISQVGGVLKDAFLENYRNPKGEIDILDAILKRPFHVASDLTAFLSLGGGAVKMSGKLSGTARLVNLGEKMVVAANKLDPVMVALKGAKYAGGKVIPQVMNAVGQGPETPTAMALKAGIYATNDFAAHKEKLRLIGKGISPEDYQSVLKALNRGSQADIASLSPNARKVFEGFGFDIQPSQEKYLTELKIGLSDERKAKALITQAAVEEFGPNPTAEQRAIAKQKIESGEWKPIYLNMMTPQKEGEFFDKIIAREQSRRYGRVGVERTGTAKEYERDFLKLAGRQIDSFYDVKSKIEWMDSLIQHLKSKGLVRPLKNLSELPEGYAVIQEPLIKSYYEIRNRAGSVFIPAIDAGQTSKEALRTALNTVLSDPELTKPIAQSNLVAIPKYLARLIDLEMGLPSGVGFIYDKFSGWWRWWAVIGRPSSYIPTAVSNAFMSIFHGVGVDDVIRSRKLKSSGLAPKEMLSVSQMGLYPEGASWINRAAGSLAEFYGALDTDFSRLPIFAHDVEKVRLRELELAKRVGESYFLAADILDDKQKFMQLVGAGPETLAKAYSQLQRYEEVLAQRIPQLARVKKYYLRAIEAADASPLGWNKTRMRALQWEEKFHTMEADVVQKLADAGKLRQELPNLRKIAKWADDAIVAGNNLMGNYQRMHPITRQYIRKIIPFWPYMKTMTLLLPRLPFLYPRTVFLWNRFGNLMRDLMQEEDVPDYLNTSIPVGMAEDGSVYFLRYNTWMPWGGVKTAAIGGAVVPSLIDPSQNPLIKMFLELKGGVPEWSKRPVTPGERMTRMDNGEVWEITKDGKLKLSIAQPSVWKSLWYLFPLSQAVETLFTPYVKSDAGWIGNPRAIEGPDGKPMFPVELLERVSKVAGVPIAKSKPSEQLRYREQKEYRVIRSFADDIRRMTPERREAALEVLKDWQEYQKNKYRPSRFDVD